MLSDGKGETKYDFNIQFKYSEESSMPALPEMDVEPLEPDEDPTIKTDTDSKDPLKPIPLEKDPSQFGPSKTDSDS